VRCSGANMSNLKRAGGAAAQGNFQYPPVVTGAYYRKWKILLFHKYSNIAPFCHYLSHFGPVFTLYFSNEIRLVIYEKVAYVFNRQNRPHLNIICVLYLS
jgi:hypothetical protein